MWLRLPSLTVLLACQFAVFALTTCMSNAFRFCWFFMLISGGTWRGSWRTESACTRQLHFIIMNWFLLFAFKKLYVNTFKSLPIGKLLYNFSSFRSPSTTRPSFYSLSTSDGCEDIFDLYASRIQGNFPKAIFSIQNLWFSRHQAKNWEKWPKCM